MDDEIDITRQDVDGYPLDIFSYLFTDRFVGGTCCVLKEE